MNNINQEYVTTKYLVEKTKLSKPTLCRIFKRNINKDWVVKVGNKYLIDEKKFFSWLQDQQIV